MGLRSIRLVGMLVLGLLVGTSPAEVQQGEKTYRVALVYTIAPVSEMAGPEPAHPYPRVFVHALRDLGYIDGKNLVYIPRSAEGKFERLDGILKEVINLKVDVIVAPGDTTPRRAKALKSTIPFVMMPFTDPVELGLAESLARPGGNFTGFIRATGPGIAGKRLTLLKEILPSIRRVAYLGRKRDWEGPFGQSVRTAAKALGTALLHEERIVMSKIARSETSGMASPGISGVEGLGSTCLNKLGGRKLGYSYRDIATELGVSTGTAHAGVKRALDALAKLEAKHTEDVRRVELGGTRSRHAATCSGPSTGTRSPRGSLSRPLSGKCFGGHAGGEGGSSGKCPVG